MIAALFEPARLLRIASSRSFPGVSGIPDREKWISCEALPRRDDCAGTRR